MVYMYIIVHASKIVRPQQPAITRQQLVNNRGMVFFAWAMPMAVHTTVKYVMPLLSDNRTATE
jgi:hypothetical protein